MRASGLAILFLASLASAQEGPPPALVVTAAATMEPITEKVELPGTVSPILDSLVASEVEGRVAARKIDLGTRVTRGQTLLRLDAKRLEKDLEIARAEKADVEAQLELAVLQERRATKLHDDGILPPGDLDEAVARRQSLEGRTRAIEARVASIRDDIERTVIHAPFPGVVTEVHTEVGEWIGQGDPAVRLARLDTLEIRLEVPERYYPFLSRGDAAPATIEALPGLVLEGKIFSLVPQADPESRTFPVLIRAKNPEGRVGAGMLSRVELTLSTGEKALLVPKDAIVRQSRQQVVYVVEDDKVRAVTVRTGRASGTSVEVFGKLRAGDSVVVRGNERLTPGQAVRVDTMEARAGTPSGN